MKEPKQYIMVRCDAAMKRAFERAAERKRLSLSQWVRSYLWERAEMERTTGNVHV